MERKICIVFTEKIVDWIETKREETGESFATVVRQAIYQAMTGTSIAVTPDTPTEPKRKPGRPPKEKEPEPPKLPWSIDNVPATESEIMDWIMGHLIAARDNGEVVSLLRLPERDNEVFLVLKDRNKHGCRHTKPAGLLDGYYHLLASGRVKDTGKTDGDHDAIFEVV